MGAANCCKKPTEVVVIEEIKNTDGEKINGLEHDSIPQDTEFVHKDDIYQQEVSNQMLYEQELSPQIGGAYEVQIKESTPEQNNEQINEDFQNYNNIQPAEFQNQNQEELKQYNLINENPNINNINQNQPDEINNIPNAEQQIEQIKQNEEEDLNKYFQIPPGNYNNINNNINVLEKSKTTNINDLDMEQIQKLIEQHQNQTQTQTQNQNQQQPFNNINIKEIPDQNQNLPQAFDINNIMNQNPNQNAATTTTTTTKTVVENTPIDLKQFGLGLENITVPNKQMTMPIQSQEEDYSKYFEQPTVTTQQISNPVNINNVVTPNITQGTTTTNVNYVVNQPILTKVNTTPANAVMTSINPQINYGLNNAQQQKTVVTTTQSNGIPTQNYFTQSYTLPVNYAQNKTTTTNQVVKTVGPTQVLQYSNTMPIDINTSSNDNKKLW